MSVRFSVSALFPFYFKKGENRPHWTSECTGGQTPSAGSYQACATERSEYASFAGSGMGTPFPLIRSNFSDFVPTLFQLPSGRIKRQTEADPKE